MDKVEVCLLDPKWEWGKLTINGVELPHLTLFHPDHGKIVCVLAKTTIKAMIEGLPKII